MNKKVQKGLVAAVAATMGASIVAPAVQAATVDLATQYAQAYAAYEKAAKSKDQKDLTEARALLDALYARVKGTKEEYLATTLTSLLDPVQQSKFEFIIQVAGTKVEEVEQKNINEGKYNFNNLSKTWQKWFESYSSALDTVQQGYYEHVLNLVKNAKTQAELDAAKVKFDDLMTMNHSDEVKAVYESTIKTEVEKVEAELAKLKVESVSAITNTNTFTVNFNEEVAAEKLTGKKLTLTPATGTVVEATFKSVTGKVATFEFDAKAANGEYVVSGEDFVVVEGTKVVYDTTAPTVKAADSKFADYKTMTIALSEKVTGTPVVKINGTVEKAENVALSADGLSVIVTRSAAFSAGTYNVVVNGLTDVATNAMMADASVSVIKAASYINDFAFTTTGLADVASQKVYFTVTDQYGQDVTSNISALDDNIVVTGTMGTFPLSATQSNNPYIAISDTLVKDKLVSITIANKDVNGKALGNSKTFTTTVQHVTLAPTSISNITTNDNKTTYEAGTTNKTLTATVLDQFGNPITMVGKVRWVIDNTDVAIFNGEANTVKVKDAVGANDNTIVIDTVSKGTATIRAFLPDGTEVGTPLVINVTSKALTSLSGGTFGGTPYNMENQVSSQISPNPGAELVPSQLKTKITSMPSGATESDLTVTYAYGTGANSDKIYATAKTNKVGTFKYVTYVGDTYETRTASNSEVTLTTTANPVVDSISLESIGDNELTAGSTITKAITFKNAHGEVIDVTGDALTSNGSTGLTIVEKQSDKTTTATTQSTKYLTFSAANPGNYTATIVAGTKTLNVNVTVQAAASLTSMTLDSSSVSVITDDNQDVKTPANDDMIAITGGKTYKLIPVSFFDQYGNKMAVNADSFDLKVTGTDAAKMPVVELWTATADGTLALADGAATEVKYIAVRAAGDDTSQALTLQLRNEGDTADVGTSVTLNVDVKAARSLASLALDQASSSAVVNAVKTFKLSGVDQYGSAVDINNGTLANTIKLVPQAGLVLAGQTASGSNDVTFTLQGTVAGNYTAKVYYDPAGTDTTNSYVSGTTKSIDIPFTVGEVGSIIDHLAIEPTVTVAGAEDADTEGINASYDASKYKVHVDKADATQTLTFDVKAFDTNNNEVALNNSDVIFNVVGVTKVQGSSLSASDVSFTGKALALDGTKVSDGDKVIVRATSINGKTSTFTITLGIDTAVEQSGTYYIAKSGATDKAITSINLNKDDVNGVEEVVLVALDQYGKEVDITENSANIVIGQDSSAYFGRTADGDSIDITAKAAGSSTLRVFVAGNQEATLTITVDQDAVKAVALAKIQAYATNNINPTPTVADYAAAGVTGVTSTNLNALNAAIDALGAGQADTTAEIQEVVNGLS